MSSHVLKKNLISTERSESNPMTFGHRAEKQPRSEGFPCHTNYTQWEFWKEPSNIKVNNHRRKWGGLPLSFCSPLRLNNSHLNEIMTVLVSAAGLLLAWNWYKILSRPNHQWWRYRDANIRGQSCRRRFTKAPFLHILWLLVVTGSSRRQHKTKSQMSRARVASASQPVKASWRHTAACLAANNRRHFGKQASINKEGERTGPLKSLKRKTLSMSRAWGWGWGMLKKQ